MDFLFVIIVAVVILLAIIALFNYHKTGDVSRLDTGIISVLKNSPKTMFTDRERMLHNHRKDAMRKLEMLCLCLLPCVVLAIPAWLVMGENAGASILLLVIFIAIFILSAILLLLRDNYKFASSNNIYVIKAYVIKVYQSRSYQTAVLAYYDYLQNKCISVKPTLDNNAAYQLHRQSGSFIDILVTEKKNKVKFLTIK